MYILENLVTIETPCNAANNKAAKLKLFPTQHRGQEKTQREDGMKTLSWIRYSLEEQREGY